MLFNSLHFLIFFPIAIGLYYATPYKWRWLVLLLSSYYFYMCWKPEYAFLIIFSTSVDYICGLQMAKYPDKKGRKKWMLLSIFMNLGQLFLFKYFNFFSDSVHSAFQSINIFYNTPEFRLLLPVGISFYTFQSISYTVDVYNGKAPAEKNFGYFAMFVSYWPQLVAGPIERSWYMLPRLKANHDFSYEKAREGLTRILWGFFKKVVIADRLAIFVRDVYGHGSADGWVPGADHGGFAIILATWLFAIEVYCDFGGYCDIAIGCAKLMGHDLTDNFKTPYFSKTIREFWQRWHITLTRWIIDYLYIPLGGSRVSFGRLLFNTWFMLLVMGFWHGANWTFIMFGAIHGFYLVMSRISEKYFPNVELNLGKQLKWLTAFIAMFWIFNLTCIPDVFFCSKDFGSAIDQFTRIFSHSDTTMQLINVSRADFYLSLIFIVVLLAIDWNLHTSGDVTIDQKVPVQTVRVRWSFYVVITLFVTWFAVTTSGVFIYFKF